MFTVAYSALVLRCTQGIQRADQQTPQREDDALDADALKCPNLEAFLDAVTSQRERTGAVKWSPEGKRTHGTWRTDIHGNTMRRILK